MQTLEFPLPEAANVSALDRAMRARFGDRISGISAAGDVLMVHVLEPQDDDEDAALDVLAAHDPRGLTPEQEAQEAARQAPERAAAIPHWAAWNEDEAAAWILANVKDMDGARAVLIDMARLLVALRDAQWPMLAIEAERVTKK